MASLKPMNFQSIQNCGPCDLRTAEGVKNDIKTDIHVHMVFPPSYIRYCLFDNDINIHVDYVKITPWLKKRQK